MSSPLVFLSGQYRVDGFLSTENSEKGIIEFKGQHKDLIQPN